LAARIDPARPLADPQEEEEEEEDAVRYAVNLPIVGEYSDPKALVELAKDAEAAGWDAVFVWDSLVFDPDWKPPVTDPWIVLGAIASHTERVKIGTMVAQLARRRPWKVAARS
jgi:alkanesulfonate monooxygenase SsuD/methylene tetrahydromethanopterin reductase-like flavin-dependent oxidoreductase (luciferase family)